MAIIASSRAIMPRSPWLASLGWTKKAGVPVEARVAAILVAIWPDLPMPVTMTRPLMRRIVFRASTKGALRSPSKAVANAAKPCRSVAMVRTAERTAAWAGSGIVWSVICPPFTGLRYNEALTVSIYGLLTLFHRFGCLRMHKLRLFLLAGLGAPAMVLALVVVPHAQAQVAEPTLQSETPLVDENLNGIEDSEEDEDATPVFTTSLQDAEDIEETVDDLPDAQQARPTRAAARAPVGGNRRANRSQRVGIDPATGALTPLANRPAEPVQAGTAVTPIADPLAANGMRLGTFTLFPTLEQSIGHTSNAGFTDGGEGSTFSQTNVAGNFISNWSRHQLRGGVSGGYTNFFDGRFEDLPQGAANVELRLDGGDDLTFTVGGTGDLRTESAVSDNINVPQDTIIDGRPMVQRYTGFAEISKGGGRLVPTLRASLDTVRYGDANVVGGGTVDQSARDNTLFLAALRLGYEVSPAWRPFVEVEGGGRVYDSNVGVGGNTRDAMRYALRGGAEFGSSDKLNGELALGYAAEVFDNSRLETLDGLTVDGTINWSPLRFTTVTAAATTQFVTSTNFGESGSVVYGGSLGITRAVRSNLSLNAQVQAAMRDYTGSAREDTSYAAQVGADWQMNRSVALFGTAGYEVVDSSDATASYEAATVRGGLRLRR